MSRRHADFWSQPGHCLVGPYTWPWSPNGQSHIHKWPTPTPFFNVNRPSHAEIQLFQSSTMKIPGQRHCVWSKVNVTFDLENWKVKVKAKVQPIGYTWRLEFNRYACFSFRGNRTTFGWDIANSIFDLDNSRSRSWPRSNPLVTLEAWSSIDMFDLRFVAIAPLLV